MSSKISSTRLEQLRKSISSYRADQARKGSLTEFVKLIHGPRYIWNWHHERVVRALEAWVRGDIRRLMISMPPRHGKSELVSRMLPAYIFGLYPDAHVIACSYSASLASDMNADVQRVMTSEEYGLAFPGSSLNPKNVVSLVAPKRNKTRFDIIGRQGYYICAGVNGPITGKGFNFGIIDDPIKNQQEAESAIARNRVHTWYQSTFYSRQESTPELGKARILITQTRWHEDDLSGRLLELDHEDAEDWTVISLPAICVDQEEQSPRAIGDPLWPDKYDAEDLAAVKAQLGSRYWAALYQQTPTVQEGNIFKRTWFDHRYQIQDRPPAPVHFYLDTAYTKDAQNDRTAILAYQEVGGKLWIHHAEAVRLEFPQMVRWVQEYTAAHGYSHASRVVIEPKASGLSLLQTLQQQTSLNVIKDKPPKDSKETRAHAVSAIAEAGRVLLPEFGSWIAPFLDEVCGFPQLKHDDLVDCLVGALQRMSKARPIRMRGRNMRAGS